MTDPSRPTLSFGVSGGVEGDRVTTLELFFDLVYVFAFTQVTTLMLHGHPPGSLVDGFIVLSLLWWSWCAFAWLANQARADQGVLRGAFVLAMIAMFTACLALPDAFHRTRGGFNPAAVVVVAYAVVRLTHVSTYLLSAGSDARLRHQVVVTLVTSIIPTVTLLAVGAAAGDPWQRRIWLVAVLYDFAAVFISAKVTEGWVVQSAAHFAERHSLMVILALGESIVSIAAGLGGADLTWRMVSGATLSLLLAVGLYAAYFDRALERLEKAVEQAEGTERAHLATDVFTYLHFPVIAGIIVTALGVEKAMAHLEAHRLGPLGGWTLGGGIALFLLGTVAAVGRAAGEWLVLRSAASAVVFASSPLLAALAPIPAVGLPAVIVLALVAAEAVRNREPADAR